MSSNTEGTKFFSLELAQGNKSFNINADLSDLQIDRIIDNVLIPTFNYNYQRQQANEAIQGDLKSKPIPGGASMQHPTAKIKLNNIMDAKRVPAGIRELARKEWSERELEKGYQETVAGVDPCRTEYNEEVKIKQVSKEEFKGRKRKVDLQGSHGTSSMADLLGDKKLADLTSKMGLSPKQYETKDETVSGEKSFGDVKESDKEQDFFRTGIKHKGDKLVYRCGYNCPNCGNSGRHYIPEGHENVSCHNCQTPLEVEPATLKGNGTTDEYRDANGNFTIANTIAMNKYNRLIQAGVINTDLHKK
ncbi:hypothetical protein F400_gp020 [Bacillus phage BCD7]|uniref:Uncharacterized protein n=1 Tax=Bacillus phage BCD7 TaxID=1136534 RepID=J9PUC4_9CAUD|nr:hypothetical protein F400_gp020 [Bacillus phage BCD7]AEZ50467.1 hypothetical protein BCD7_0020 [Bacillus phage BCD7]